MTRECAHTERVLERAFLGDAPTPRQQRRLRMHLRGCVGCQGRYEGAVALDRIVAAAGAQMGPLEEEWIAAGLDLTRQPPRWRWPAAAAIAAAIVLGVGGTWRLHTDRADLGVMTARGPAPALVVALFCEAAGDAGPRFERLRGDAVHCPGAIRLGVQTNSGGYLYVLTVADAAVRWRSPASRLAEPARLPPRLDLQPVPAPLEATDMGGTAVLLAPAPLDPDRAEAIARGAEAGDVAIHRLPAAEVP